MARRKRYILFGGAGLLAIAAFLCFTRPSTPAGRYVASSSIGACGDFYYELADGRMSFVVHEPNTNGGTYSFRDPSGVYFQTNGAWVYFAGRDLRRTNPVPVYLQSSWFGLSMSYTNGTHDFLRRRLIPFRRPEWMLDWLPWCIQ